MPDSFPEAISQSMASSGSDATCVPVKLGAEPGEWEAAIFLQVAGPESKQDRRALRSATEPLTTRVVPQLMTHPSAALVTLELSVHTVPGDPLRCEILMVPGQVQQHYQGLKLLATQRRLCWFFGDSQFQVIQAQSQELDPEHHHRFEAVAREAFAHDALLRMTNQYDSDKAVKEIASHYAPRQGSGADVTH